MTETVVVVVVVGVHVYVYQVSTCMFLVVFTGHKINGVIVRDCDPRSFRFYRALYITVIYDITTTRRGI